MDGQDNYKIELLKGSANYRTWKFSVKMVLQAKDLWDVVSGVEVKPEVETEGIAWEKRARKALAPGFSVGSGLLWSIDSNPDS